MSLYKPNSSKPRGSGTRLVTEPGQDKMISKNSEIGEASGDIEVDGGVESALTGISLEEGTATVNGSTGAVTAGGKAENITTGIDVQDGASGKIGKASGAVKVKKDAGTIITGIRHTSSMLCD